MISRSCPECDVELHPKRKRALCDACDDYALGTRSATTYTAERSPTTAPQLRTREPRAMPRPKAVMR